MRTNQSILMKILFITTIFLLVFLGIGLTNCNAQYDSKANEQLLTYEQLLLLTKFENTAEVNKTLTSLGWTNISNDNDKNCFVWIIKKNYNTQFVMIKKKKVLYSIDNEVYMKELKLYYKKDIVANKVLCTVKLKRKKKISNYTTNLENL